MHAVGARSARYVCLSLSAVLLTLQGCGGSFLGLEDYQRDLLLGGLAAALLANTQGNAADVAAPQSVPGADGVNCWDLNQNGVADADEDTNGDGTVDVLDCRGANGADGADGADGANGADGADGTDGSNGGPGPPGPEFFSVFIDDFFTDGSYGQLHVVAVPISEPVLGVFEGQTAGPAGFSAVAFRASIPTMHEPDEDVTLTLFLYRTGPYEGNCLVLQLDAVRLAHGGSVEPYGETRWISLAIDHLIDEGDAGTVGEPTGVFLAIDIPVTTVAGLGYPPLDPHDFVAFEVRTVDTDGGSYQLLGADLFSSATGSSTLGDARVFDSPDDVTCGLIDCNDNGLPDDLDIRNCESGDPACADCNENGVPDECDIVTGFLPGDVLYGSQGGDTCEPLIFTIDPTTGVATEFVNLDDYGPPVEGVDTCGLTGLAMSDDGRTLWVSNRYDPVLFIVDTVTRDVDVLDLTLDSVPGDTAALGEQVYFSDLAFLPDGRLIGCAPHVAGLGVIDPITGVITELCLTAVPGKGPVPVGLSGLTVSPSGVLYGSTGGGDNAPVSGAVVTVDLNPGQDGVCYLTPLSEPTGFNKVSGLDFGPDGRLFGSTGFGTDNNGPELIEIDVQTGLGTLVAEMSGDPLPENIAGLAFDRESAGNDCNENGVPDECDIEFGTSTDCQPNGIPDECDGGCVE